MPRSLCLVTLSLLAISTSARHIHHRPAHQHAKRVTPVVVADASSRVVEAVSPSITAGNDAIEDIQDIQEGLSNLPGDLLSFVQAVEARLEEVEGMLSSLIGSSAETNTLSSPSTRLPPAPSSKSTITSGISASPIFFTISSSLPPSASSTSSDLPGTVPVAPAPTVFQTSRMTSTRVRTVTQQPPQATGSWPSYNGTSSQGNFTVPYATIGAATPVPIRTFTVVPAPGSEFITSTISASSTSA